MRTITIPNTNVTLTEDQIRAAVKELDTPTIAPITHLDIVRYRDMVTCGLALHPTRLERALERAKRDGALVELYNDGSLGTTISGDRVIGKFQGFKGF